MLIEAVQLKESGIIKHKSMSLHSQREKDQLDQIDVEKSRNIANVQILVECVICVF